MRIHLPLENWVQIFGWPCIDRKNLDELMEQINDREFWSILMFCLHEVGQVSIGHLAISPSNVFDVERDQYLEFAVTPLPKNIDNFKLLNICWAYDRSYKNPLQFARCWSFFRKLIPLFTDINLSIRLCTASKDLLAMLGGWAHQVEGVNWLIAQNMVNFGAIKKFFPGLLKMTRALAFVNRGQHRLPEAFFSQFSQLWKWLTTKRKRTAANIDGGDEFKVLVITYCQVNRKASLTRNGACDKFAQMILLEFTIATTPANFLVVIYTAADELFPFDQIKNETTGERLIAFRLDISDPFGLIFCYVICRHSMDITFEWLCEFHPDLFIWTPYRRNRNFPYPLELNERMIEI